MIIEIKGTGSHNKGAEMMLLAILQQLKSEDTKFTIVPKIGISEYTFYSKLDIFPKIWFTYKRFQFGKLGKFIPNKFKKMYGLVSDDEVDVILDSSGFAYSSQWGDFPTKTMAIESRRWKKMNKKIILMPQAFGPFETDKIKNSMKEIIENVTLIYARDEFSYKELLSIKNDKTKIKQSPDFTALFNGSIPKYFENKLDQVCIVPNQRMKDKRDDLISYEDFFAKIILKLQDNNLTPFFLIHGGAEDIDIAKKINSLLKKEIEIINEENPFYIKGIIQNSIGLIGSRFHSLASGLYSAVPTIGTGWSHKYKYLFDEFNFKEGLIDLNISDNELDSKLEFITKKEKRDALKKELKKEKNIIEAKSHQLFEDIKSEIKKT